MSHVSGVPKVNLRLMREEFTGLRVGRFMAIVYYSKSIQSEINTKRKLDGVKSRGTMFKLSSVPSHWSHTGHLILPETLWATEGCPPRTFT